MSFIKELTNETDSLWSQHWLWHAGYKQKYYLGSCETTCKVRFENHKKSFNHAKNKNDTNLSKEFWEIKKCSGTPKIRWKIIRICRFYDKVATYRGDNLLNKRTEIINTCRHRNKYKLANCHTIDWRQIHAIRYHYNASL